MRRIGVALALSLLLSPLALSAAHAGTEDDSAGLEMSVQTTSAPAPGSSPAGGSSGSPAGGSSTGTGGGLLGTGGSAGGGASGAGPSGSGGTGAPNGTTTPGATVFDGLLFLGGLGSGYVPGLDPLGGSLDLDVTVRNVSNAPMSVGAEFWMTNVFGARIAEPVRVSVAELAPDETRVVRASVEGVGLWAFLTAHARITPPDSIDGTPMSPVVRDAFVIAPPWLLIALVVLLGIAVTGLVTVLRHRPDTVAGPTVAEA